MPLKKIPLPPGFDKNDTASQAEGRWIDGDNVRFQYGSPEKIGGWRQITSSILVGAGRDIHSFFDLTGRRYLAFGTNKILYILYANEFYDITPLKTALTSCTFNTTTGSATVTVNKTAHGLSVGDLFTFTSVTPPTGFIATDFTTNTFEVKTVPTTGTFTITMATTSSGTASTSGSASVNPYYQVGPVISTFGYGWGAGPWGTSTWGTERSASDIDADAGSWSLDNFGELLIATIKNGSTFKWNPNAGAGVTSRATIIAGNPTKTVLTRVSDRDRHLIHFGTETTIGNPSTQDPMFIRFSDQEDIEIYEPTSTNTAGTFRLDNGSRIVAAVKGKDYMLILTDEAAYTMQFVGPPFTFSIRQVGSNCGCIGQHAAVFVDGAVYWMGDSGNFFVFDGTVKTLPSSVEDFVFTTQGDSLGINFVQGDTVFAGHNSLYTEISWFYSSARTSETNSNPSEQNNRVATYNYELQSWVTGTLSRTTYEDAHVLENPSASKFVSTLTPTMPTINGVSNGGSYLFEHEVGVNEVFNLTSTNTTSVAISAFIKSGDFDLDIEGDGEFFIKIRRFIPDFKYLDGNAKVTLFFRAYPADTTTALGQTTVGPFTISSSTDKIDTRARGRLAAIKIENDALNDNWRYGVFRLDIQPDGRGGSAPQT
jgi:hypothetical protein